MTTASRPRKATSRPTWLWPELRGATMTMTDIAQKTSCNGRTTAEPEAKAGERNLTMAVGLLSRWHEPTAVGTLIVAGCLAGSLPAGPNRAGQKGTRRWALNGSISPRGSSGGRWRRRNCGDWPTRAPSCPIRPFAGRQQRTRPMAAGYMLSTSRGYFSDPRLRLHVCLPRLGRCLRPFRRCRSPARQTGTSAARVRFATAFAQRQPAICRRSRSGSALQSGSSRSATRCAGRCHPPRCGGGPPLGRFCRAQWSARVSMAAGSAPSKYRGFFSGPVRRRCPLRLRQRHRRPGGK